LLDLDLAVGNRQPHRQAVARDDEGMMSAVPGQLSPFDHVGRYKLRVLE
jgi:hypothetical protein